MYGEYNGGKLIVQHIQCQSEASLSKQHIILSLFKRLKVLTKEIYSHSGVFIPNLWSKKLLKWHI